MQMILKYLSQYEEFEIAIFEEDTIKNMPVEVILVIVNKINCAQNWPLCNVLIGFYSNGFPLEKAIEYA